MQGKVLVLRWGRRVIPHRGVVVGTGDACRSVFDQTVDRSSACDSYSRSQRAAPVIAANSADVARFRLIPPGLASANPPTVSSGLRTLNACRMVTTEASHLSDEVGLDRTRWSGLSGGLDRACHVVGSVRTSETGNDEIAAVVAAGQSVQAGFRVLRADCLVEHCRPVSRGDDAPQ
jgi:hypothetical protein